VPDPANLFTVDLGADEGDPEGYECRYVRVGPLVGGMGLGASVYELTAGQSVCPYHYEYGNEEWLLVLEGTPILRHPAGEDELRPGDVVCFPEGPEGAHKVTNLGAEPARIAILSTKHDPAISVYPDSDKIGVFPGNRDDNLIVPRSANVDYWEGERT
jgi:uncharacterized cupin superfamily protein